MVVDLCLIIYARGMCLAGFWFARNNRRRNCYTIEELLFKEASLGPQASVVGIMRGGGCEQCVSNWWTTLVNEGSWCILVDRRHMHDARCNLQV